MVVVELSTAICNYNQFEINCHVYPSAFLFGLLCELIYDFVLGLHIKK